MRSLLGWAKYEADCSFAGPELSVLVAAKYRSDGTSRMASSEIAEGVIVVRAWQAVSVFMGNAEVLAFRYTTSEPSVSITLRMAHTYVHGSALVFVPTPKRVTSRQTKNMSRNSKEMRTKLASRSE